MALELKVSTEKYEAQIALLESQLAILKGLAGEYASLQAEVSSFSADGEIIRMANVVAQGAARVDGAITATQANIDTLRENATTVGNVGANISNIIEEGINIVGSFI